MDRKIQQFILLVARRLWRFSLTQKAETVVNLIVSKETLKLKLKEDGDAQQITGEICDEIAGKLCNDTFADTVPNSPGVKRWPDQNISIICRDQEIL
jgi:hypothetical protein